MYDLSLPVLQTLTEITGITCKPHYVVSWCELGVWARILEVNGQVLETLTERTAPLEDLKTSLCRLLV